MSFRELHHSCKHGNLISCTAAYNHAGTVVNDNRNPIARKSGGRTRPSVLLQLIQYLWQELPSSAVQGVRSDSGSSWYSELFVSGFRPFLSCRTTIIILILRFVLISKFFIIVERNFAQLTYVLHIYANSDHAIFKGIQLTSVHSK